MALPGSTSGFDLRLEVGWKGGHHCVAEVNDTDVSAEAGDELGGELVSAPASVRAQVRHRPAQMLCFTGFTHRGQHVDIGVVVVASHSTRGSTLFGR
jgi:hypothetical protein